MYVDKLVYSTQDGSGVDSTQMDIQMLKEWKSAMERKEFSINGDNVNIDELIDRQNNQLNYAKILKMKAVLDDVFDLMKFKSLIKSKMSALSDIFRNKNCGISERKRVDILARSIISCACSYYMTSISVKELKSYDTYMYICSVVSDFVMNSQIDIYKHVDKAINDQRKRNEKTHKLVILTRQPDKKLIKSMNVKELKKQILNDAYSIIKENPNHNSQYMSYESFKTFYMNVIKFRCEDGMRNFDIDDVELYVEKNGFDYFFKKASEFEFLYAFVNSNEKVKEKPKIFKETNAIGRSRITNIPDDVFENMKSEMITTIKRNKGSAKFVKREDLAKESKKMVRYVKSLPESDHLSNV
ncbi:uncharacterized protein HGUI_03983 [Hanseniaspora guilliermondii]|uniref:Uncharacterized protein n=1 Tax=Hanseniaspora guilliermondii TaxID=56406 RepID=A0A1L0FQC6_9ASCO|nr:uncharacterized protein HGUI_03983 [Hanseniaspora guilliermondii]